MENDPDVDRASSRRSQPAGAARDPRHSRMRIADGDQDGLQTVCARVPSRSRASVSSSSQRGNDEGREHGLPLDDRKAGATTAERYARHALIDWFDQDAIKRERLIVVGAGAVGNEVLKNLALLGVGELQVFDKDTIEVHNLTRSVLFRESDLGQAKATCAAARIAELDPSVRIRPCVGDFWTALKIAEVAAATAVFCCVDNFEARIRLNRLCAIAGTPLINVGIDSRFSVVEHFPFTRSNRVPCYECGLPPSAYGEVAKRYSCGWLKRVAYVERKVPTTILTSSAAASLAVSVYLRWVTGGRSAQTWRYFQDSFTGRTTRAVIERLDGCPGCADLLDDRLLVTAGRRVESTLREALGASGIGTIRCSDRVITTVQCRRCELEPTLTIFDAADRYDETLMECPSCHERSRVVVMKDRFSLEELVRDFSGRSLPGKFVMACVNDDLQVIVELEGDADGGRESNSEDRRPHAQGRGDSAA